MATVWLAEDLRHARRVAIKVLHPELSTVLGPERFLAEIRTTANLQHPHILPLFDSGSAEGLLYYVMPYVEGETLRARLERERQLPVADAQAGGQRMTQTGLSLGSRSSATTCGAGKSRSPSRRAAGTSASRRSASGATRPSRGPRPFSSVSSPW
jgi:serine/threonine protein kinase